MPSIPPSPRTPTKRRKSSIDLQITSASPQSNSHASRRSSVNRRGSQYSIESPTIQRLATSQEWPGINGTSSLAEGGESNGLGNLADELAEAFDEDEEPVQGEVLEGEMRQLEGAVKENPREGYCGDSDVNEGSSERLAATATSTSPHPGLRIKHRRMNTSHEGSDNGYDSEQDLTERISSGFDSRLVAIEGLAQPSSEAYGDNANDFVQRFADTLKELPSQSRVENGVTRYAPSDHTRRTRLAYIPSSIIDRLHPIPHSPHISQINLVWS